MRKLLLLPLLAGLIAVAAASTVSAHSRPVRFDPAPGAILDTAPDQITGWFSSDIRRVDESFIHVLDPEGTQVQTGEVDLTTDRRQMSTALQSGLPDGRYIVHWSTFDDADGEVFSGCYAFFVGHAAADAAIAEGLALDGGAGCPVTESDHSHAGGEGTTDPDPNAASIEIELTDVGDGSATLNITPTNFTPRAPDGTTVEPNFGHYHIYLDKVPVDILSGEHSHAEGEDHEDTPATGSTGAMEDMDDSEGEGDMAENLGGLVENPVMWVENSYTFTDLEPGFHTVTVVLNHDNHSILSPPVIASETFRIEGAGSGGDGIPAWTLALGVIGGLVVGGAGMKLVGSRA